MTPAFRSSAATRPGSPPSTAGRWARSPTAKSASVHAVTDQASCPLDWRLFLPESWDADVERRRKAHVPDDQHHRPKWQLALDMLDELAGWDLAPPVVLADAAYGEVGEFRLGLEQRQLAYVVLVPATGVQAARTVAWREGADGEQLVSRFVALRVRPAGVRLRRAAKGSELPVRWLLAEWPDGEPEPIKYWLASLPADTPLARLVHLAKLRWRVEMVFPQLTKGLMGAVG